MKNKSNRHFKTWKPHFHYYVDKHYGGKNAWRNCKRAHHYFLHHPRELYHHFLSHPREFFDFLGRGFKK